MLVQLSQFSCGGIAIAASLSHRIADASTLLSFLIYWASLTRNSSDEDKLVHLHPWFVHDLLPAGSFDDDLAAPQFVIPEKNWITREITFHNSKIAELRAELEFKDKVHGVEGDVNYTRNDLVTAILYRCLVAAASSNSGVHHKSVLLQVVNMRPLIDRPLPKTSVGNLVTLNPVLTSTMSETELKPLVCRMREGRTKLRGKEIDRVVDKYIKMNCKGYVFSSICNLPIYDEMDFGWGRPAKATIVDTPFVNAIIMMDTPCRDGIKAIVALEEEDMKNFLVNKELRTYASV
ncbi:diaboline synthase-like [Apium graveolens]|uniref:diaboline synthase-like n=1 Tax=Apium graveolens TaxID=4045 RepID=UPI003D7AFABF